MTSEYMNLLSFSPYTRYSGKNPENILKMISVSYMNNQNHTSQWFRKMDRDLKQKICQAAACVSSLRPKVPIYM